MCTISGNVSPRGQMRRRWRPGRRWRGAWPLWPTPTAAALLLPLLLGRPLDWCRFLDEAERTFCHQNAPRFQRGNLWSSYLHGRPGTSYGWERTRRVGGIFCRHHICRPRRLSPWPPGARNPPERRSSWTPRLCWKAGTQRSGCCSWFRTSPSTPGWWWVWTEHAGWWSLGRARTPASASRLRRKALRVFTKPEGCFFFFPSQIDEIHAERPTPPVESVWYQHMSHWAFWVIHLDDVSLRFFFVSSLWAAEGESAPLQSPY